VRDDVRRLTLRFADGHSDDVAPTNRGYVLMTLPKEQRRSGHELVEIVGYGANGHVIARLPLEPR
jgi:hypothetical protein